MQQSARGGRYRPGRMNCKRGRKEGDIDRQVDAWCSSETEGHPVRLKSPGRVGTGDDGVPVRDHTLQRVLGNKEFRLEVHWEMIEGLHTCSHILQSLQGDRILFSIWASFRVAARIPQVCMFVFVTLVSGVGDCSLHFSFRDSKHQYSLVLVCCVTKLLRGVGSPKAVFC